MRRLAAICAAICAAIASCAAAPPPRDVLVLAGGFSRAAHQAGVLAAHLADAKLDGRAVIGLAGSSVGAINTLLGAVEWCASPARSAPTSLLWRTWTTPEWRDLLPGRESCESYRARNPSAAIDCTDGSPFAEHEIASTSNAMARSRAELTGAFTRLDYFRPGCAVRLGVALASEQPAPLRMNEEKDLGCDDGGEVGCTRRRQIVVDLRVDERGRARFCAAPPDEWAARDGALRLEPPRLTRAATAARASDPATSPAEDPRRPCDEVDPGWLLDAVMAASTYPVATRPTELRFCGRDCAAASPAGEHCPETTSLCSARFTDATVVDRVPLALGRSLVGPAEPASLLILDSRRDFPRAPDVEEALAEHAGLAFYRALVVEWLETADDLDAQRLHRASRLDGVTIRRVTPKHPITGDLLAGVGAFIHRQFRQHDFAVGVHDWRAAGLDTEPATSTSDWGLEPVAEAVVAALEPDNELHPAVSKPNSLYHRSGDARLTALIAEALRTSEMGAESEVRGADPNEWPLGDYFAFAGQLRAGIDRAGAPRLPDMVELRADPAVATPRQWMVEEAALIADRFRVARRGAGGGALQLLSRLHPHYDPSGLRWGSVTLDGHARWVGLVVPEQLSTQIMLVRSDGGLPTDLDLQWRWLSLRGAGSPLRLDAGPTVHVQRQQAGNDQVQLGAHLGLSQATRRLWLSRAGLRLQAAASLDGAGPASVQVTFFVRAFGDLVEVGVGMDPARQDGFIALGVCRMAEVVYWAGSLLAGDE